MKIRTLTLSFPHENPDSATIGTDQRYRVEQVTDSVEYAPGQMLLRAKVSELCDARLWKVTVRPPR